MARACPDDHDIAAFLESKLDPPAGARIERHVAECEACRVLISELVRGRSGLLVEEQRRG